MSKIEYPARSCSRETSWSYYFEKAKEIATLSHHKPHQRIEDSELALIFHRHPFGTTFHALLFAAVAPNNTGACARYTDYDTTLRYIANLLEMQDVLVQIISGKVKNVL